MTPEERVQRVLAMREWAIELYMSGMATDRETAIRAIARSRQAGRRRSRSGGSEP